MRIHINHNSGPGAAHGAGRFGFGRRPMLCEQVDGGGGGSSGGNGGGNDDPGGEGERLFTQTEVNEMMARARREGRNAQQRNGQQQRQQQPSGGDDRIDRLAGVVEQLAAMLKPPAEQPAEKPKRPPTDYRAPGGKVPEMPNNMGLVDIYRLTPEQFGQLTPQQILEHHRRAVEVALKQNGAVPLPMALRNKGGQR